MSDIPRPTREIVFLSLPPRRRLWSTLSPKGMSLITSHLGIDNPLLGLYPRVPEGIMISFIFSLSFVPSTRSVLTILLSKLILSLASVSSTSDNETDRWKGILYLSLISKPLSLLDLNFSRKTLLSLNPFLCFVADLFPKLTISIPPAQKLRQQQNQRSKLSTTPWSPRSSQIEAS